jgi:hypothetical protein
MATITAPIWKDTYYTTTADTVNYSIRLDGETIFTGKGVKYPGADDMQLNINKICRNYLECDIAGLLETMPSSNTNLDHPNAQRTFNFYTGSTKVNDYVFYQDYSYTNDKPTTGSSIVVSNPINGHFVSGMLKVRTYRGTSSYYTTGSASSSTGLGYTTRVKCVPYVLYYLNSYGGWDAFAIEGTGIKKDAYTTYKTDQSYNNTTLQFETNKYVQEIKTSYELNTGLLSDEQSANLAKNLLGSIKVYLQNIDEGWIKPVIITDSNITYQTYQTNGRKLCQYKINVQMSQSKIRK